jgi:acyl carrier protein
MAMNCAKEVRDFIVTNFLYGDGAPLKDETSFLDSGIIDSTGMLELIMFIETSYGIKVQPEEMVPENLDSLNRVVRFITSKQTSPVEKQ